VVNIINKKTVLITGGAKGIGSALSTLFSENNYNVIINYCHSEKEAHALKDLLKRNNSEIMIFQADITKREQVVTMINAGLTQFGSIDILVNNAGICQQKLFIDLTESDWDQMMSVHLKGMYYCCKELLPEMIKHKQGKIINISSIWGMIGASCEVHYSTAKAAIIGFTKALAKEVGPSNIQVNCVAPGIIETEMNQLLTPEELNALINETPLLRIGKAIDVAHAVLYLASEHANFITGQVLSPNGGLVI